MQEPSWEGRKDQTIRNNTESSHAGCRHWKTQEQSWNSRHSPAVASPPHHLSLSQGGQACHLTGHATTFLWDSGKPLVRLLASPYGPQSTVTSCPPLYRSLQQRPLILYMSKTFLTHRSTHPPTENRLTYCQLQKNNTRPDNTSATNLNIGDTQDMPTFALLAVALLITAHNARALKPTCERWAVLGSTQTQREGFCA